MCGILGVSGPRHQEVAKRLLQDLVHRGPDGEGHWSSSELSLGHRRLTIIGLDDDGLQPMTSQSGKSVIVFNGEIYNYLELAEELERLGRPTDRRFDTSILIEALEMWGANALAKLNGMFALAWYRPRERRLLLARDRWGKKPLFWGNVRSAEGSRLAFSSELRTFSRLPGGPPPSDPLGVARYLVYDGMPLDRTVYRDVYKVPAATWIELDPSGQKLNQGRFWHFKPEIQKIELHDALEACRLALAKAVDLRLRSDVPVGLFLSGGIDSSLLAATWRNLRPDDNIKTFTVGFEDPSYDERPTARLMAQSINAEHHEFVVTKQVLEAALQEVWDRLPEPFADPSIVPTALLCRFAREEVKVAIGGDGADEFQAGYDPFRAWRPTEIMNRLLPRKVWHRLLGAGERFVPADGGNMSTQFKLHHFAQGFAHSKAERIQGWMASFPAPFAITALKPELAREVDLEEVLAPTRVAFEGAAHLGDIHAQIAAWVTTYLESSILTKVDRASMMHSLEVRAPFLDPELAILLSSLPPELIYHRGRGKILLKRMARQMLPSELLTKPKKGLGVPITAWLGTTLRDRLEQALADSGHHGWFRQDVMTRLWEDHRSGRADNRKALWNFLFAFPFQTGSA